jgi:phage N-6-adenine-methyltransferase
MARHKAEQIAELEDLKLDAKRSIDRIDDKFGELEREHGDPDLSPEDHEEGKPTYQELLAQIEELKKQLAKRKMPKQKPGQSKQDYATPMDLIRAVEKRFGVLVHDLCAHAQNARVASYYSKEQDCFKQAWAKDFPAGNLWGNPEFGGGFIGRFVEKCFVESRQRDGLIIVLTPASIGSNWYAEHVEKKALVIGLRPRLSFDGIDPYPKDCMLSVYGLDPSAPPSAMKYLSGFETWNWKE